MQECLEKSNIIVITTIEPEFKEINLSENNDITIIDCWRQLSNIKLPSNIKYHAVGLFNDD